MIVYALVGWALIGLAVDIHEFAHGIVARRRGAQIGEISVGVPGLVLVFSNGSVKPAVGRPLVRWKPGANTSSRDQIWIFRAGPISNMLLTITMLGSWYFVRHPILLFLAAASFLVGIESWIGLHRLSDGAQIRELKRELRG